MLMAKNCPNVFLDLSFTQHYFPKEIIGNQLIFIINKLDKKVFFGSDFISYPYEENFLNQKAFYQARLSPKLMSSYFNDNLSEFTKNFE